MRLVVSGGGSGGHIYPILSVLEALVSQVGVPPDDLVVLYIGGITGMERALAEERDLPFEGVHAAPFRGGSPDKIALGVAKTVLGTLQAWSVVKGFRPDAVFATGGYVSVPAVLAGWALGVPSVIYLPDVEPGWAVKLLARFAHTVAVTTAESQLSLKGANVVETGYPVRSDLFRLEKAAARRILSLEPSSRVLLVMGGSQGSHSLNMAIGEALPQLLDVSEVVHVCGLQDQDWLLEQRSMLPSRLVGRYHLYDFLRDDIVAAMVAADLAVGRAGASVLGELPAAGLPAILVPYPYAGRHQERNAAPLVNNGAAIMLPESDLKALAPMIQRLLQDSSARMNMSQRMKALARPDAAARIAGLLSRLAHRNVVLESGVIGLKHEL